MKEYSIIAMPAALMPLASHLHAGKLQGFGSFTGRMAPPRISRNHWSGANCTWVAPIVSAPLGLAEKNPSPSRKPATHASRILIGASDDRNPGSVESGLAIGTPPCLGGQVGRGSAASAFGRLVD
jgi:hypothetical protein